MNPGVWAALGAAALFGAGTPLAKLLLGQVDPWLMAGLLYLGAGAGLTLTRLVLRSAPGQPARSDWPWLFAAILCGGVAGPVLLMYGLSAMSASAASLLLNAEGLLTVMLAWFVFRENFSRRIAFGMLAILAAALLLSWPADAPPGERLGALWPTLAVLGACLAWALDNNFTRKVSLGDATWIAACKGWVAGIVNITIFGAMITPQWSSGWPSWGSVLAAGAIGWLAYGVSLALFVVGLRHLGTARTAAYFSVAPFAGALISLVLLNEPVTLRLAGAGVLMAIGVWLHLSERHEHAHRHAPLMHSHEHDHNGMDPHHAHTHRDGDAIGPAAAGTRHTHAHTHAPLAHAHPHFPDAHHRHDH